MESKEIYLEILKDYFAGTYWNNNSNLKDNFEEDGYCTRWIEVMDLKEGKEIAVPETSQDQNRFFDLKNLTNSPVVNTLTSGCSLKCGSFDQIGHLPIDNDRARYSVSSGSDMSLLASTRNASNFDFSTIFMCPLNFEIKELTSLEDKEESNLIRERCSFTSSNKYSGPNSFSFLENNRLFVTPIPASPVNIIPESTINSTESIYLSPGYSFLYRACNPLFTSLANRIASSSVSLDLETILLNSSKPSCSISRLMASSLATSDQLIQENFSIFAFNSSDIVNDTFAIYASPLCFLNNSNSSSSLTFFSNALLNTSDQFISECFSNLSFNSFGNEIVTVGIFDNFLILMNSLDYVKILENVQIYKPFENKDEKEFKFEKISSIKVLDKQQVYDLAIEGTHNFIANDIIAHNTNRYLQYLAKFNTSNASWTPRLLNVTLNYTGLFTDSRGNYNLSFIAPSGGGTYPIKVNTTFDSIPGENSVNLVFDTSNPTIKGALNKSVNIIQNDIINATFNATDDGLSTGQVIINDTGIKRYFNFSLSGTSMEFSQNFTVSCSEFCVVNVTGLVNDTFNRLAQNEAIFTVTRIFTPTNIQLEDASQLAISGNSQIVIYS